MAGSAILNKQPIFTSTPIIALNGRDVVRNIENTYQTDNVTPIYHDVTTYGSCITKITVNANGILGGDITAKRVDLYISTDGIVYNLFTSKFMTGLSNTTPSDTIPSVIFEFPNGLITPTGTYLGLTATDNFASTDKIGDYSSVIIEGGTYDQPA